MAQTHHQPVVFGPRCHLELGRQSLFGDDQE
jgi:hypothetical protein